MEEKWEIEKKDVLAHGGQGIIYYARASSHNMDVILKEIINGNQKEIIEKELRIININHPNVVKCYGMWKEYLIFEYVNKGDLENMIDHEYDKLVETPISHIEGILKGLDFLHKNEIIHLDLHPKNILVDVDQSGKFVMKISDFGLSEMCNDENFPLEVLGRACYVSPEKVKRGQINIHSDIWALGCILWKLLTKQEAYNVDNHFAAYYNIGEKKHPDVPLKWPVIIQKIFFQCWDLRNNASEILNIFKNERIKRETESMLINEMPLKFYQFHLISDSSRVVPAIEWESVNKFEVFEKYCFDRNEFEKIKRKFSTFICKRKFDKIIKMMDLLIYLNENGHVFNIASLNQTCIGTLCEMKKKLVQHGSKLQLIKFARYLGMLDGDIENLNDTPIQYFVTEIFEFWTGCRDCQITLNEQNFNKIVRCIGLKIC